MIKVKPHTMDLMDPKDEVTFWTKTLGENLMTDHLQYEVFSELHSQALCLRQMSKSYASVVQPKHILPEPYLQAMLRFRNYPNEAFMIVTQYKLPHAGSPPWRNHYYRETIDADRGTSAIIHKEDGRLSPVQRRLGFILEKLTTFRDRSSANEEHADIHTRSMKRIGITKIVDTLQHCVESEPDAKTMLTPYIASSIGTLATISECLHQLELYQPWASSFDKMLTPDRLDVLRSDYAERALQVQKIIGTALQAFNAEPRWGRLGRIGAPTTGRFSYPIWRRKNEKTVTALRTAEGDLDAFWNGLDKEMMKALDELKESHLRSWFKQPRELQRTPPWVEPLICNDSSTALNLHTSVKELDLTRQQLTERTISDGKSVVLAKAKVKTRGGVNAVEFESDRHESEDAEGGSQDEGNIGASAHHPTFKLNARALKIFKTVFFTPCINATPGEVAWTDFRYAMKSIGFAPEAIGGSMWQFHPETVGVKHGIVLHGPHPAAKMPYQVARRHGRSLRRAYGWEGHMFSLA
jgi:hypothetical protein